MKSTSNEFNVKSSFVRRFFSYLFTNAVLPTATSPMTITLEILRVKLLLSQVRLIKLPKSVIVYGVKSDENGGGQLIICRRIKRRGIAIPFAGVLSVSTRLSHLPFIVGFLLYHFVNGGARLQHRTVESRVGRSTSFPTRFFFTRPVLCVVVHLILVVQLFYIAHLSRSILCRTSNVQPR